MMGIDNKGAFDKLVAGLNSEDRLAMLHRINQFASQTVQFSPAERDLTENKITLKQRFQKETFFYKVLIWLKSIFTKQTVDSLYEEDIIASLAKKISKNHPGIVNHKEKTLDYLFYERLLILKDAADFFRPYYSFIRDNPGDFYVFLSSFVAPELSEKINTSADPFIIPLSRSASAELRSELFKRLDEILNNLDPIYKHKLYAAIEAQYWLERFSELPFIHFISQFTNVTSKEYISPYKYIKNDFNEFAKVFYNIIPISNEVLEAIFLFSQRKNLTSNTQDKDVEKAVKDFIISANTHFSAIQAFSEQVPILTLARIVNENYQWEVESLGGPESWFAKFKSHWRFIIEIRWNDWLREQKKQTLSESLKLDFGLTEFPVMAYRPWLKLWTRVPFSCELTGGFLSWFVEEKYEDIINGLNLVAMEGVFFRSENRTEYSEGLSIFSDANTKMKDLLKLLSPEGEYGKNFEDYSSNKLHTIQIHHQIENMMGYIEETVKDCIKLFGKGARTIERVFHGFFDEKKDGIHEPLQNINLIKTHDNKSFREILLETRDLIKRCLFYISELEPIDSATQK